MIGGTMRSARTGQILLFAILFLFFLQGLSDFIQSIYAFGLLVTAFTIQLVSVLLLFSPVALLLLKEPPSRPWIIGLAAVAMLGRLLEPMMNPGGRLVASGFSVGAFMLLFPSLMAHRTRRSVLGWSLGSGLAIAVLLSILFRAAGSSLDATEMGIYQFVAWVLAVLAGRLIWNAELSGGLPEGVQLAADSTPPRQEGEQGSTGRVVGLCVGLIAVVVMVYISFMSPTVIARWTASSYPGITIVLLLSLVAFVCVLQWREPFARLSRTFLLAWNALFVLALLPTILPHQVAFPSSPSGYPLDAPVPAPWAAVPLYAMLVLSPVIFVDLMLYARQISEEGPSIRQLGGGFALAALLLLVMVFLQVFTTIYDYAAPVGPLFRDRLWLVYLIAGLAVALPMLLVSPRAFSAMLPREQGRLPGWIAGSLAILTVAALMLTGARPPQPDDSRGQLRVMTYNIQQSFDRTGAQDLVGQLNAIRHVDPDILGLQESDTTRIANGNVDAVRFLADRLHMYSYYGPTTTTGTFGIALLSKYPIQNARTFFMYSPAEQTACIQAEVVAGGKTYNVFVTHLGNGGPMIQLENVLSRVDQLPDVLLMGDFNFGPKTPQYAQATQALQDAWQLRWPTGHAMYSSADEDRIDQVFVSPGTQVIEADYVPDPASDHPYLYVVVKP
jgi:endonuclease/exonuclease/phosphatase family metal-dependent hydrolase